MPLFLVSGATSLVYQTLWVRHLHLVVGTSQIAVCTVLAAFMTGLAAGGFAGGRVADRVTRPLVAYGVLELFIGAYALAFPMLIEAVEPLYLGFWRANQPDPLTFASFQFVLLGVLLLPPTICMGATLPLLARFATTTPEQSGVRVGRLYGANTLGAVIGTALAGFWLLPALGLSATNVVAAAGNALLAALAIGLGMRVAALPAEAGPASSEDAPATEARKPLPPLRVWSLMAVAALAGLSALLYEVAWFRLLVLQLGGSTYAFTVMLLAFLLGIGLGGWAGGSAADRAFARGGAGRVLGWLAAIEIGIAGLAWVTMWFYGELPFVFVWLFVQVEQHLEWLWPAKLLLSMLVMLPPTLLMGAAFPFLVRAAAGESLELGGHVGRLYGWNTLGAIFGASVGGLYFLPEWHIAGTVLIGISLNLLAAWCALHASAVADEQTRQQPRSWPLLGGWGLAILWGMGLAWWQRPPWDEMMMTSGMYKYVSDLSDRSREGVIAFAVEPYELLFYDEGLSSVVTVARSKSSDNIWLANNGKVDASTSVDMPTQLLVAHLPFAFKPDAEEVVVIGLASGITAGAVTLHSAPKRIDLVELEPAVVEASHYFDAHNSRPLDDPRVTLFPNDGRNHIALQDEGTYDLVVSEPSNPWLTGVSNLFTQEFFELGKARLKPGGVWAQWVQMYGMDTDDLRTLLATFAAVYPHVQLFSTIEDADLVLIGSESPLELDEAGFRRMFEMDAAVNYELGQVDIEEPIDLLARWQLDRELILRFSGDAPVNTDDNMRIEYSAPLHLHEETASENFLRLLGDSGARDTVPLHAVQGFDATVELARAYARRDDWVRALVTLKAAERITPGDATVQALYLDYQAKLRAELDEGEDGEGED